MLTLAGTSRRSDLEGGAARGSVTLILGGTSVESAERHFVVSMPMASQLHGEALPRATMECIETFLCVHVLAIDSRRAPPGGGVRFNRP